MGLGIAASVGFVSTTYAMGHSKYQLKEETADMTAPSQVCDALRQWQLVSFWGPSSGQEMTEVRHQDSRGKGNSLM